MGIRDQIQNGSDKLFHEYSRVEQIKKYINENLATDLRAAIVSEKFELSISSLLHVFKKHQGRSYQQCVEQARMTKAFYLITKEKNRVQQAMYATGYKYKSTFNNAFKRKFKYPPRYFQK